ncbi:MAG: cation:dicarboxylase symporter family transporter [Burkholderiales bacterium]|nr:cation:dicarboxylase symporter family transporter [Burkholderiales bacterium]
MGFLRRFAGSPLALLACLVAGGLVGRFVPEMGAYAAVLGQVYLGVVGMAALPLLVVATFFGLRQTLALPQPGWRVLMIIGLAIVLVAFCAAVGTALGALANPGKNLDYSTREYLGALVQQAGTAAGDTEISLINVEASAEPKLDNFLSDLFPDNFFRALVDGKSLGILLCAIVFGLAFAALSKAQNSSLTAVFEAIYRALEIIISRVNLFIPVLVFSMAAYFVARTDPRAIVAMSSFLGWFLLLAAVLAGLAVAIIRKQSDLPVGAVLAALKAPALISLTSASTTASIPDTIDAMSNKLGFSRGIVELVTPISSVFLRSGSALYYALLTTFVANLYGRTLAPTELLLVCAGASIAAFASAGNNSAANVGFAGMVLAMLQLPAEAALALFLAIDVICEGPRNLLTVMFACALIALVSRGLPSERQTAETSVTVALAPIRFAFTRADLLVGAAGSVIVAILLVVLGIGVGMKRGDGAVARPAALGLDNAGFVKRL